MLDRSLREPLFQQLAGILRDQITSGGIAPDHFIPPARDLRREHGVSQTTIDRATAILKEECLVREEKGKGLYVTDPAGWVIREER
jgi:DNA-binding GntR family transcriptional regulator